MANKWKALAIAEAMVFASVFIFTIEPDETKRLESSDSGLLVAEIAEEPNANEDAAVPSAAVGEVDTQQVEPSSTRERNDCFSFYLEAVTHAWRISDHEIVSGFAFRSPEDRPKVQKAREFIENALETRGGIQLGWQAELPSLINHLACAEHSRLSARQAAEAYGHWFSRAVGDLDDARRREAEQILEEYYEGLLPNLLLYREDKESFDKRIYFWAPEKWALELDFQNRNAELEELLDDAQLLVLRARADTPPVAQSLAKQGLVELEASKSEGEAVDDLIDWLRAISLGE